jgi:BirA family transcriptional regulator, biotin operon repressor / biotin---[acetyl-CoA-carboxylase] ligase
VSAEQRLLERVRERGGHVAEVRHFASLPSTNDHAKALARRDARAWTVVIADEQTAGRGRQGHTWASPAGGLYLSVVLRPKPPADARWGLLPLAVGLAVVEALDEWDVGAALKWPNDVLRDGRKLGGILVEGASGASGLESAVVGIGVNIGLPRALPDELRAQVAWLGDGAAPPDRFTLAAAVLARLGVWYDRLARESAPVVLDAWRARSVPWWGRRVEARSGASTVSGILRGLAPDGGLVIEQDDGRESVLHSGDVREVRSPDPDPSA